MWRYSLSDSQWGRIKDLLPGRKGHVGGKAAERGISADLATTPVVTIS